MEKKREGAIKKIQRWFKSNRRLVHIRDTMPMRKRALRDLMERLRSMRKSEDDVQSAFRVAGTFCTSERYRTFVKQFLGTIPTSREIRLARPKRLRSTNTFVTGLVLATLKTTKTEEKQVKKTIDYSRNMLKSLERLVNSSTQTTSLRILNLRVGNFNMYRYRFMKEFHVWRRDFIENFLEEVKPIYTQLLLLRSSKDASGAVKRLDTLLGNISRVVGREEARQFDLERRREAAGKLALMLGENTAEDSEGPAENVQIGTRVMLKQLGRGVVRFLGETEFGAGGVWAGIELSLPVGRNNGSVRGKRYFTCTEGHGVFVRPKTLLRDKGKDNDEKEEVEEEVDADDEGDDEKITNASATSVTRRNSSSTKRIPSPWTVRPPPTRTTTNNNTTSETITTKSIHKPAWLSSGMSSAGGMSSDGRGGMSSDGGDENSAQANRRRRQSMARQLASLVSQRVQNIAKRYNEISLVHEVILNENFCLTVPDKSQVNKGLEHLRDVLKSKDEWKKSCEKPVLEISNELVKFSGRGEMLADPRNAFVSSMKALLDGNINRKHWRTYFVCAGRLLMKLQSPAYDEETRIWMRSFEKDDDDNNDVETNANTFVDALSFIARHLVIIHVESMNHVIKAKLLPLLQGRGGVDFERRELAQLVKAGSVNLNPDGTSLEIHQWLRESVSDWCKHFKDISSKKNTNEKRRLRSLLLQDANSLESCGIWAFLDLVLPKIPVRPVPPTLSLDRARILLLRNKLHGISVKCCLANVMEQIVTSIQMKRPREDELKGAYDRFEALLLSKDTKIENLTLQVEVEVKSCLKQGEEKVLDTHVKAQIKNLVVNEVMNPNSRLVVLVRDRLRHVLCTYLQASARDFSSVLAEARMQFLLPDLERIARPKSVVMRSGRRRLNERIIDDTSGCSSEGILRKLFRHHWAVHAPYYVPILVCAAQNRAKEMLS